MAGNFKNSPQRPSSNWCGWSNQCIPRMLYLAWYAQVDTLNAQWNWCFLLFHVICGNLLNQSSIKKNSSQLGQSPNNMIILAIFILSICAYTVLLIFLRNEKFKARTAMPFLRIYVYLSKDSILHCWWCWSAAPHPDQYRNHKRHEVEDGRHHSQRWPQLLSLCFGLCN